MALIVFIDFNSANAWLALEPTRQLAKQTGVAVDWRPFSRKPKPGRGSGSNSKGARQARIRAAYRQGEAAFYAEQRGIPLVYPTGEGLAANAGLAWLRRQHGPLSSPVHAYVKLVFEQVWSGAINPGDRAAVGQAIATTADEAAGFDAWFDDYAEADLEDYRRQAGERGVVDAPGYVVQGEPFVGRAHLPVVRRLLAEAKDKA